MNPLPPRAALPDFILLYVLLYGAFGVASPYLPGFIAEKGVPPELIGIAFGSGTAIRLLSAPIAGRLADRTNALRLTMAWYAIGTAIAMTGYLLAQSFVAVLMVTLLHAFFLAPTTNLADALALATSRRPKPSGFEYGWVRGAGSAGFILGSLISGLAIASYGLGIIVWLQAVLLLAVPLALMRVPAMREPDKNAVSREGMIVLLRMPVFQRITLLAALILGSHALHDTFSVIRWRAMGISAQSTSMLWSLSVAAEVVVFFTLGPWLLHRIKPSSAIALAALTGAFRWLVAAMTTDVLVLSLIQPLHGITFALLHLACMRILAHSVAEGLAATAQAIYGTVAIGATTAVLTIISGYLYARMGAASFLVMSILCLAALPICWSLPDKSTAAVDEAPN